MRKSCLLKELSQRIFIQPIRLKATLIEIHFPSKISLVSVMLKLSFEEHFDTKGLE